MTLTGNGFNVGAPTVQVDVAAHDARPAPNPRLGRVRRVARRRARSRWLRRWVRNSMVPIPCAYIVFAIALGGLTPTIDRAIGTPLQRGVGLDAAHDVLTSLATGMLAFTGLVVASVLLMTQFGAAQFTPRLVLWFRGDPLIKQAIGSLLAAPLFALVALREIERRPARFSPDITVVIALALLVGAALLFLALLRRVLDRLRPRYLYAGIARQGIQAVRAAYPVGFDDPRRAAASASWSSHAPRVLPRERGAGVVTSFDSTFLTTVATWAGVTIELVPGIGEFVTEGQPLLRVHGDAELDAHALTSAIEIADERTIEQDPAFALRIIVDLGIRALSSGVHDPTTAAQALDALEMMMRELGARDLEASLAVDEQGVARLIWPTAGWSDLLDLAFDEIRSYGAGSVQVCRRLRAVLEDLRATTPVARHAAIDTHLARLEETVKRTYAPGSGDLAVAAGADRTGLGRERRSIPAPSQ